MHSCAGAAVAVNDYLVRDGCINWWDAFIEFAKTNATASVINSTAGVAIVSSAAFNVTFRNFYGAPAGELYQSYLIVNADNTPRATRIACLMNQNGSTSAYQMNQMFALREEAKLAPSLGTLAYSPIFLFTDGLDVRTTTNLVSCMYSLAFGREDSICDVSFEWCLVYG